MNMLNDPFFIGFENIMKNAAQKAVSFPPYNLVKVGEHKYVLELATAGFSKSELSITLDNNTLQIQGKSELPKDTNYIYKGISNKAFTRSFAVAETIEVESATYNDGILQIVLKNNIPQKTTKSISIA